MIDFDGIRAANPIAEVIGRFIELKKKGTEYAARCPFHDERTPSFYVVPKKAKAFCMGCGWQGDVVDFVAAFDRVDVAEAAKRLGGGQIPPAGTRPVAAPAPPDDSDEWEPILPVPKTVEQPFNGPGGGRWVVFNPKQGRDSTLKPVASWAYKDPLGRLLGWVLRCLFDDGRKWTPTITYCKHRDTGELRWCMRPFPRPRPLYGVDQLLARPDAPVLLVEGEKCADVRALPGFVLVTWPGGTNGAAHADFAPLHGRAVTAWPDADAGGLEVMREILTGLAPHCPSLRIVDVEGQPKGWDIADAVDEGWDTAALIAFCRPRVRVFDPDPAPPSKTTAPVGETPDATRGENADDRGAVEPERIADEALNATPETPEILGAHQEIDHEPAVSLEEFIELYEPAPEHADDEPATPTVNGTLVDLPATTPGAYESLTSWAALDLALSEKGVPVANLDNAARILERHPEVTGRFWYDEFLGRILTTWNPDETPVEWSDADDVRLGLWLQRKLGIGRMAVGTARDAVTVVAMAHRRNECREWLRSLVWDGHARLHLLLPIGFGTDSTPYTESVGRCFVMSMAARVLKPGCKVDTMPVFVGSQGAGKSTALQVLASERWFGEASESLLSKDFFQALQGKMLIEIGEMDTFGRAEIAAVKRVMSCQVDRYRAPYGRRSEDHPRMSVFGGSVNEDEFLRDATGARRFWPVTCGPIDLGWIRRERAQLFAEAVAYLDTGRAWWDVPADEAAHEQEQRRVRDEWEVVVEEWLNLSARGETTVGDVLQGALGIKPESWDRPSQMRAANALKALGWKNYGNARRGARVVKIWRDPRSLQVST